MTLSGRVVVALGTSSVVFVIVVVGADVVVVVVEVDVVVVGSSVMDVDVVVVVVPIAKGPSTMVTNSFDDAASSASGSQLVWPKAKGAWIRAAGLGLKSRSRSRSLGGSSLGLVSVSVIEKIPAYQLFRQFLLCLRPAGKRLFLLKFRLRRSIFVEVSPPAANLY